MNTEEVSNRFRPHLSYWFKLTLQPVIAVLAIVALAFGFGYAQKMGYFVSAESESAKKLEIAEDTEYVCPMLCVPPSKLPGRCPVCGMELKPRKVSGDSKDVFGLTIDPASRRLSNIQTAVATTMPLTKQIEALGQISYDQTSEATIAAYVDGRLEKLFVDFTGAEVKKGEPLARLYSPELYSAQTEMLESKVAMESSDSTRERIVESNRRLYDSSRQRLIEFGISESQIEEIIASGKSDSRINIVSPLKGTVTEKMAVEGQYVKTGTPLFKISDLSNVWLMLELFPEDAGLIRYGQNVTVDMQSLPGRTFSGRVAFVDPALDTKTQTIRVRVVIPNDAGLIRIGDYATASVQIELDPSDQQGGQTASVVVPRQSVLISGDHSVAYVETVPGRFEFRQVTVGPTSGEQIAIVSGIEPGEQIVSNAAFMVDAAFNMSGKPSLIDPTRAVNRDETGVHPAPLPSDKINEALSELSPADRELAVAQQICPVSKTPLGSMGTPLKVDIDGRPVFICCEACRNKLLGDPQKYSAIIEQHQEQGHKGSEEENKKDRLPQLELPQMKLTN